MERDEHLRQELDEFKKEKERIRNIVGEIGGKNNKQHKIVSLIFVLLIGVTFNLRCCFNKKLLYFLHWR